MTQPLAQEPQDQGLPVVSVRLVQDDTQNKPVKVREVVTNFGRVRFIGDNSNDENPSTNPNPGQNVRQIQRLLNKVPGRKRLLVSTSELAAGTSNPPSTTVYLGKSRAQLQDGSSFHIPAGVNVIELHGTDEIWVGMAFGATGVVAYAAEYGD